MLYVDRPRLISQDHPTAPACFRGREAAHLCADSEHELIIYGQMIGLRAAWIQKRGTPWAHFDVMGAKLQRILRDRRHVKQVTAREMVLRIWEREKVCA